MLNRLRSFPTLAVMLTAAAVTLTMASPARAETNLDNAMMSILNFNIAPELELVDSSHMGVDGVWHDNNGHVFVRTAYELLSPSYLVASTMSVSGARVYAFDKAPHELFLSRDGRMHQVSITTQQ